MNSARTGPIDHVSVGVRDLGRAITFYDAAFAPLDIVRVWTATDAAGYGYPGGPDAFAIKLAGESRPIVDLPRAHVAFVARDRAAIAAFHGAALGTGGADDGAPGFHPEYGPGYFAAFAIDPDGNRVEAVLHEKTPERET